MTPQSTAAQVRAGTSSTAVEAVLDCIAAIRPEAAPPGIQDDLIRARVIDSLAFFELLFMLEERSGRAVDLEASGASSERLRSVAGLAEQFYGEPGDHA